MQVNIFIDLDTTHQHVSELIAKTYDPINTQEYRMVKLSNDVVIDGKSVHEEDVLRCIMPRYGFNCMEKCTEGRTVGTTIYSDDG